MIHLFRAPSYKLSLVFNPQYRYPYAYHSYIYIYIHIQKSIVRSTYSSNLAISELARRIEYMPMIPHSSP